MLANRNVNWDPAPAVRRHHILRRRIYEKEGTVSGVPNERIHDNMIPNRDLAKKPKIFVLEDETITAHHLQRILTRLGYEVSGVAADGLSALQQFAQATPDLLLADVGLEGEIDGVEVANRARDRWKLPTVFLTAYSDPETMRRARVTEPYGYLVKPFAEQELHATIEIALQQKHLSASRERDVQATAHILGRTQEELTAVSARFSAQEQERQRIARDLHDDIGQRLALLQIHLEKMCEKLPGSARSTAKLELIAAVERVIEISKGVRDLSHHLHPQILDDLGLETAVRELCETFENNQPILVRFSTRNVPAAVQPDISLALYRIVQECLQNIAKHSRADAVNVALIGGTASVELTVRDNGSGFDASSQPRAKGLGLISMAQRAKLVGGDFELVSYPGTGTRIHVRIPLGLQASAG